MQDIPEIKKDIRQIKESIWLYFIIMYIIVLSQLFLK
jgi:hypothetical protein